MNLENWNIKFRLYQLKWQAVIFIPLIIIAFLLRQEFVAIVFIASFIYFRMDYGKTYHTTLHKCIFLTVLVHMFFIMIIPSVHVTLFGGVAFGMLLSLILFYVQDYIDKSNYPIAKVVEAEVVPEPTLNLSEMTEIEIHDLCRKYGFRNIECEIVVYL